MPIELNNFIRQAAAMADNASLHVDRQAGQVEAGSGLRGLNRLSSSARREENRTAIREFMDAITRDPRYTELVSLAESRLESLAAAGRPLTAGGVRDAILAMDVARGVELGRTLAAEGRLPAGHGSAFGQYAVVRNFPLDTPDQVGAALRDYLRTEVMERNSASFTRISGMGGDEAARTILLKVCEPLNGQNGFFARMLDHALAGGVDNFSFQDLEGAFEAENAASLEALRGLNAGDRENLARMPAADMLAAMREALPVMGQEGMRPLFLYMAGNMPLLDTPAARADCARECLLHQAALPSARTVAVAHGLPENFDSALGHNPEVVKNARALLDEDPGAGVLPAPQRAAEALSAALEDFVAAREPDLREFARMAENPPAGIEPPLTPETLPRYLNTLLAGDALLEPLLDENAAIDEAFMEKLSAHAAAMNSATHSFRGDFGADDVAGVLRDSIFLLLARRGVTAARYPEIMGRIMNRFGGLASGLTTLNFAVQRGYGRAAGMAYLGAGMTAFRALEGHGRALLSLMSREQRAALGAALPEAPNPDDAAAARQDAELATAFLEKTFQNDGDMEELPDEIRSFARACGLDMPDMDPAVRARLERRAFSELSAANFRQAGAVLDELAPNTGHVREAPAEAFLAVLAEAGREHDLAGIDPAAVSARAFSERMQEAAGAVRRAADEAGVPVNPADVRAAVAAALTGGLEELKATLDAVDALPGRTAGEPPLDDNGVPVFTAEEKAWIREAVQRTGLRDAGAIARLADAARAPHFADEMSRMSAPAANAKQLAETARRMTAVYLDAVHAVGVTPGSEDAMSFMVDLATHFARMTPARAQILADNLNSGTAQNVAGAFLFGAQLPGVAGRGMETCMGIPRMMNEVRMAAEAMAGGNPELDPLFFSSEIGHLCEVPHGVNGCMHELQLVIGNAAGPAAEALSRRMPPLSREEWDALAPLVEDLQARAAGEPRADLLAEWVADSADELLAALASNRGRPLSDAQLWAAIVGDRMPRGMGGEHLGRNMLAEVDRRCQALILAAAPDTPQPVLMSTLMMHSGMGIGPRKMMELARPGSRLTLADIHTDMSMSSLRDYTPDNAYGLVTDFRRRGRNTEMVFMDHAGNGHAVHPFDIPDGENRPDHPEFQAILRSVRGMTQSEGQTARVLQAFSQAALIMPRVLSTFFPGVQFSEHGNFSVRAVQQNDGSVLVDIASDPALPLIMTEQFRIETDGTHSCTAFEMRRPPAGG